MGCGASKGAAVQEPQLVRQQADDSARRQQQGQPQQVVKVGVMQQGPAGQKQACRGSLSMGFGQNTHAHYQISLLPHLAQQEVEQQQQEQQQQVEQQQQQQQVEQQQPSERPAPLSAPQPASPALTPPHVLKLQQAHELEAQLYAGASRATPLPLTPHVRACLDLFGATPF